MPFQRSTLAAADRGGSEHAAESDNRASTRVLVLIGIDRNDQRLMKEKQGRSLVIGPAWVGDMVMAHSLFRLLRAQSPEGGLDVLAPPWTRPLLEFMPEVDSAVTLPFKHGEFAPFMRARLGRSLRGRYDRAYVLPNSWKSALVPFFAGIPLRIGYRGEARIGLLNEARALDPLRLPRTVDRFRALAFPEAAKLPDEFPRPQLTVATRQSAAVLKTLGLSPPAAPCLALCPGAEYGPAKRWPLAHFASVARARIAAGWQVWILGSEGERSQGEKLAREIGAGVINLAGRTSLADAVALLALADAVVCNDSGMMHIAAALDRPLVAIYGSSSPRMTPPLGTRARALTLALPCSPCYQRQCPLGHLDCLNKLMPDQVLVALESV